MGDRRVVLLSRLHSDDLMNHAVDQHHILGLRCCREIIGGHRKPLVTSLNQFVDFTQLNILQHAFYVRVGVALADDTRGRVVRTGSDKPHRHVTAKLADDR